MAKCKPLIRLKRLSKSPVKSMMNKYSSVVRWSEEDEVFIAVCPELGGISAFGDTPAEALAELEVAAELAVETYLEKGWPLPVPAVVQEQEHSGQFRARLPRSLHAQLAQRAEMEGVSLNMLVVAAVSAYLGRADSADRFSLALRGIHRSLVSLSGAVSSLYRPSGEESDTLEWQDPVLRRAYGAAAATLEG